MKHLFFILAALCCICCVKKRLPDTVTHELHGAVRQYKITAHKGVKRFGEWHADQRQSDREVLYFFSREGYLTEIYIVENGDSSKTTIVEIGDTVIESNKDYTTKVVYNGDIPVATLYKNSSAGVEYEYLLKEYSERRTIEELHTQGRVESVTITTISGDTALSKTYNSTGDRLMSTRTFVNRKLIREEETGIHFEIQRDKQGLPVKAINAERSNAFANSFFPVHGTREYIYTFDEHGNWITCAQIYKNQCDFVAVREIVYY